MSYKDELDWRASEICHAYGQNNKIRVTLITVFNFEAFSNVFDYMHKKLNTTCIDYE
jgi:hypothetical protein